MEQPPKLDQFFRAHLHDAEVPPPAFVWPRVEEELRRRRRRVFLWLWLGLALTGAGLWSLWQRNSPVNASAVVLEVDREPLSGTSPGNALPIENARVATIATPDAGGSDSFTGESAPQVKRSSSTPALFKKRLFPPVVPSAGGVAPPAVSPVLFTEKGLPDLAATGLLPAASAAPLPHLPGRGSSLLTALPASNLVLPQVKPFLFKKKKPLKNCYDFARHPQVWLVDAYVGPSLPQRQLTAAQSAFQDYLQQRRSTEHAGWAFNAGVRGSLLFGRHFLLRTGLHYEQMTEVFEYADPDFVQVTITQTTKLVDGVWQTIIDTIGVSYGEHYVKTYNRFGMLEVPLLAGAEFRHGRAGLSLQAGAALNVYFWKRGTILNAQGDPESFTPGQAGASTVFRQRAGWSATASAQLFYHLRPRVRVFAEPYYSRAFRPLTLANQPIEQHYATWGLKLGVTTIFD